MDCNWLNSWSLNRKLFAKVCIEFIFVHPARDYLIYLGIEIDYSSKATKHISNFSRLKTMRRQVLSLSLSSQRVTSSNKIEISTNVTDKAIATPRFLSKPR